MDLETNQSTGVTETPAPSQTSNIEQQPSTTQDLPEVYELEKLPRFKFQGQDLTAKELEKLVLFQKDYTTKTQKLSEQRKDFESQMKALEEDKKFQENLEIDLENVKRNPQLASKFLEVYPAKYHQALQKTLNSLGQQQNQNTPSYEMLALQNRLNQLESQTNEQKVQAESLRMNSTIESMAKKYPDALPELVIGRVFEAYNQMLDKSPDAKLSPQTWEDTFKAVDGEMKQLVKSKYSSRVKQQLEANSKAKDVAPGGAIPGRAPQKFKSLREVTQHAVRSLKS